MREEIVFEAGFHQNVSERNSHISRFQFLDDTVIKASLLVGAWVSLMAMAWWSMAMTSNIWNPSNLLVNNAQAREDIQNIEKLHQVKSFALVFKWWWWGWNESRRGVKCPSRYGPDTHMDTHTNSDARQKAPSEKQASWDTWARIVWPLLPKIELRYPAHSQARKPQIFPSLKIGINASKDTGPQA